MDLSCWSCLICGARGRNVLLLLLCCLPVALRAAPWAAQPDAESPVPDWTASGPSPRGRFGHRLATGDFNGDGRKDVAVSAPSNSIGGSVFVYLAKTDGTGLSTEAAWTIQAATKAAEFGAGLACLRDVNGDGCDELLVGMPMVNHSSWAKGRRVAGKEGWAGVFLGKKGSARREMLSTDADWRAGPTQSWGQTGRSLAAIGDINGDGLEDFAIAAPAHGGTAYEQGLVLIYHGVRGGLPTEPALRLTGARAGGRFGMETAGVGDVNKDGYADVVIGSSTLHLKEASCGAFQLHLGSATGLSGDATLEMGGYKSGERLGSSISGGHDVNGDGFPDFMVGAPGVPGRRVDAGRVIVALGGVGGLNPGSSLVLWGRAGTAFGHGVSILGDINGDSLADFAVASPDRNENGAMAGAVLFFLGSPSADDTNCAFRVIGSQASDQYGTTVFAAGDINGDGLADTLVGSTEFIVGKESQGRVDLVLGSTARFTNRTAWIAQAATPFKKAVHREQPTIARIRLLPDVPDGNRAMPQEPPQEPKLETADVPPTVPEPASKPRTSIPLAMAVAAPMALAGLLAVLVLRSHRQKRLAEEEIRNRVEEERKRISRNIHDILGADLRQLALIREKLEPGGGGTGSRPEPFDSNIQDVIWLAEPSYDSVQALFDWMADRAVRWLHPLGLRTRLLIDEASPHASSLSSQLRSEIVAMFKEAMVNLVRHARAKEAIVSASFSAETITFSIRDDGCGFDPSGLRRVNGLENIRYRAKEAGGTTRLISAPGQGTLVEVSIPLKRRNPR